MKEVRGKGARGVGYKRARTLPHEWNRKEGWHTWPVTLRQSEVIEPDGRSWVGSPGAKGNR